MAIKRLFWVSEDTFDIWGDWAATEYEDHWTQNKCTLTFSFFFVFLLFSYNTSWLKPLLSLLLLVFSPLPNSTPLDPLLHYMIVCMLLGFLTRENKELKKLDNNRPNNQITMVILLNRILSRGMYGSRETFEEIFNILSHEGNAYQNYFVVSSYNCQSGKDS